MPKKIVPLVTGEKYHVYNRGVDKRTIFLDKTDYLRFYQSLAFFNTVEITQNFRLAKFHYAGRKRALVQIHAYCLLPNHFHFILEQLVDGGVSEFMKRITVGYTGYFNEKYERSGALFQGTFKRVHVASDTQFRYLFSYVNENHTVHNVNTKREICHTSSLHYQGIKHSKILSRKRSSYNMCEASKLAESIYKKRKEYNFILE